ncbi:MAG: alpha-mannosidase [Chloroflexi bacterium]|nr:alpha-mannosidase [Chloroflexota bacterium]
MDMNSDARARMQRRRTTLKNAERRAIRLDEHLAQRLDALLARAVTDHEPLPDWQIRQVYYRDVGEYEPVDPGAAAWQPIRVGETWGGKDVSAFFRREITIPERMAGQRVCLRIYVDGDSLLRLDGAPYHGLDHFRNTVLLSESAAAGATHLVELESYIHWYTSTEYTNVFSQAELVTIDAEIEAAYWDLAAAFKTLFIRDIDPNLQTFLETHLQTALLALPLHEPDVAAFKALLAEIRAEFRRAVYATDRFKVPGLMHMVGHSHLDIVYVWPQREYIRKIGRTHATMLRLMEQYPQFTFAQSSAKIYADMQTYFPEIYAQVKQRIAEGRWGVVGAFWLEPDCNLISGESFVRHILHGQRFWQREFGLQSRVCWQPDVFGMTWALPQILRRSGIDVVLSNKFFVWNDTNPWRKNTFWWEGPDGSRVLTVIPPGHFIGMVDPDHMDEYWGAFSDKASVGETIYTYGWGDGGGGVDPEMIECAVRYTDFPGLVPTRFAAAEEALLSIAERSQHADLPVWRDEMYLETHRGTYTSKARLKRLNRESEILYRQVELLATLAWRAGHAYPAESLDEGWKLLLGTQFHDALPGTHITEVYDDLLRDYDALQAIAHAIRAAAAESLFGADDGAHVLIFNPLLCSRAGVIRVPAERLGDRSLAAGDGAPLVQQRVQNLDGGESVLVQIDGAIPAVGYRVFALTGGADDPPQPPETELSARENVLENRYLRAEFDSNGELIALWDKAQARPVLRPGERGNRFQLYTDRPGRYDAWDIVASYVDEELPINGDSRLTVDESGPVRAALRLVRRCYNSTITQRISLLADSRELTFETEIDWHERQRLLKVGFPLAINARHATYDIAYGSIERATHRNTAHDAARFEVPAHWWMDMSESGYGVALLNDCKYGHEAHGHWMRLTLLKGSVFPDPTADREVHHFTYALYPHGGGWRDGGVIDAAARLNTPLYAHRTDQALAAHSFIQCDAANVTLEAVKRSERGDHLIVRLVERHNALTRATLTFDRPLQAAQACDLMERVEQDLPVDGRTLHVELQPCEIVTLALQFHTA